MVIALRQCAQTWLLEDWTWMLTMFMFDFPSNAIDYLHCTGRTARMGAKGKVTSLITKKDLLLATRIEEAIKKNESLESLTAASVRQERSQQINQKGRDSNILKSKTKQVSKLGRKVIRSSTLKPIMNKTGKRSQRLARLVSLLPSQSLKGLSGPFPSQNLKRLMPVALKEIHPMVESRIPQSLQHPTSELLDSGGEVHQGRKNLQDQPNFVTT